jgi:SCY1-like protein 2
MAANMLAAATTTLGYLAGAKSSALSAYIIQSAASPGEEQARPFHVGLWKVVRARHRTTGRQVAVWTWEKRPGEAVEAMKKEVSRHLFPVRHQGLVRMMEANGTTSPKLVSYTLWLCPKER